MPLQVPNSPLLPEAVTPLLTALTTACQQGGSPPLAARLHAIIMALSKCQAQLSPSSGALLLCCRRLHFQLWLTRVKRSFFPL